MSGLDAVTLPSRDSPFPQPILEETADWLVKMHRGLTAAEQNELATWIARSEDHARAWSAAAELSHTLGRIPKPIGMSVLQRRPLRRRTVMKSLAGLMMAGGSAGWMATDVLPKWLANYRTGIGERRSIPLGDGSRITLNTDSAIDVAFDERLRLIVLEAGEILVEAAADSAVPRRLLRIHTPQGSVEALGTVFSVRLRGDHTEVGVREHSVRVQPKHGAVATLVRAGERCRFAASGAEPPTILPAQADAWVRGQLVANDMRLGDFIEELSRYRAGLLRCDAAVADLRISGVFQIDDTANVLAIVQETLPVAVRYRTRFWAMVGPTHDNGA